MTPRTCDLRCGPSGKKMDVMKYPQTAYPGDGGPRARDALEQQANAWVRKLASGAARRADVRALERWCATSDAHRQAFSSAHRRWTTLGAAAQIAAEGDAELAALRRGRMRIPAPVLPRRMFIGGAAAAAVAAASVLLLHPPLSLWQPLTALQADYQTGTGEQRQIALLDSVSVELNTRSSINLRTESGRTSGIELVDGEVAVDVAVDLARAFTVVAGGASMSASNAVFEVRRLAANICVSCREGLVDVLLGEHHVALARGQQLTYTRGTLQTVSRADNIAPSVWREGILSFNQTALTQVVDEINRYRPGRVILIGDALGGKTVSGRFNIRDLDKAIAQVQRLFRLDLTTLPGGVVVLS